MFLIPGARHAVGPAEVTARARVGWGETVLRLPPLGAIEASTHSAPVILTLSVDAIDIETLAGLATTSRGREQLRAEVERDLAQLARGAAVKFVVGGLLLGALVGAILFHRRWQAVSAAAGGGVAMVLLVVTSVSIDYDVGAFASPRYTGTLTRAQAVLETLNERIEVLEEARSRYEIATRKLSDLFVLLSDSNTDARVGDTAILHVSDIHANPIGLEVTQELAREFDVDLVIDTGDISSAELDTGEISRLTGPLDAALARSVGRIGVPYVFVPGNHDSPQLRDRLARQRNVHVLVRDVVDVAGIEILGWADPTFSTRPVAEEIKAEERAAMARDVEAEVLSEQPDILAVHDVRLAEESFGDVPIVLAGHTHERDQQEIDSTLVLTVGSTGATGLKSFTVEAQLSYEAEIVYLDGGRVVATDYVSLADLGTDFTVERRSFETDR